MFEREHHRRVALVLDALDGDLLAACGCLFGGGTAIVLRYGEYRESADVDFLVSSVEGYRTLRQRLTAARGLDSLTRPGMVLEQTRELRADQYGLRTGLRVLGAELKFEILREARIQLEPPDKDRIRGIPTLTPLDMAASKLLANSDRWADDSVYSRDLIDLAMMSPPPELLAAARDKAKLAYGESIDRDLASAIGAARTRSGRLDECMRALRVDVPKAMLWNRIRALAPRRRRSG